MKLNITKYIIAAAIFLAAATPVATKAQYAQTTENTEWEAKPPRISNPGNERTPFTDSRPPAYAPPPEGGDGQKLPIHGGLWVLIGLAVAYGVVYRKCKEDDVR